MNELPGPGPLIPGSTAFQSQYSYTFESNTLIANSLTDGVSIMSAGVITGLLSPVNLQDAVNKEYTDSVIGVIGTPVGSLQANSGKGTFQGLPTMIYTNANTSTIMSTSASYILISNDTIVMPTTSTFPYLEITNASVIGISVPTTSTITNMAVNKSYMDNFYSFNSITVGSVSSSIGINASQMVNTIMTRIPTNNCIDVLDNATNVGTVINNSISAISGTSARFIMNNAGPGTITLTTSSSPSLTFYPSNTGLTLFPNYTLDSTLQYINGTTCNMFISSINYTNTLLVGGTSISGTSVATSSAMATSGFIVGPRSQYVTSDNTIVTDSYQFNTSTTLMSVQNVIYTPQNFLTGPIIRNYEGTMTDTFAAINEFILDYNGPNNPVYYFYQTGAMEVVIMNTSSSGSVLLVPDAFNQWTMDPNSNNTIGPGQTGYFYVYVNTSSLTGNVYVIGIS